jgi:putative oxidoreductase
MLKHLLFGGAGGGSRIADLGLLVLRLFAGLAMALTHGWDKFQKPSNIIGMTERLGFPAPTLFGWMAIAAELAGGVLLALGLATRPAAFLVGSTMAVAAFLRHRNDAFGVKELALLYLAVAVCLMLTGAGRYGVDVLLRGGKGGSSRKRKPASDRD